ncbi:MULTISPECIES: hypothetical protein [unclassified Myroides]|uniref:hypothetical protein n=1 Tax=unclassified Myroides TaxID=2642485 RepID=UPI0015F9E1B9|nr:MULTISPECIES: hypothetical protein [unclassified Myroides]MBB1148837.1 hypothetical protein [Myroides sp. NP-2]MDM1406547.1 hypothetical protein [Myroides sp. DF42-4-2]
MLRKAKVVLVCAMVSMGLFSCSSDDNTSSNAAYEVVAKTSDNAVLRNIVVVEGDGTTESIADLGKKEWSKSFAGNKIVAVSVTAQTIDSEDNNGELTLEVVQGGKVIKTSKANGSVLVANISM